MPMARTWNGMTIQAKVRRASGRAIVAIGMNVAVDTKRVTHRVSGTLARSVHVATIRADHEDDEQDAQGNDLMLLSSAAHATQTPLGLAVEVGSWLPYACVEWVGRQHPGVTVGLEAVRGVRADTIVRAAFREEGL